MTGGSAVEKCISHFRGGFAPNLSAVLIGVPVIVFMCLYPKKWNAVVPSSLVAIVLATAAAILWRPEVDTVGAIPSSLLLEDRFSFADFTWANINGLLAPDQGLFPPYAGGRYELEGGTLIVSRGLARESTRVPRVFNRPELVIIDVTPAC